MARDDCPADAHIAEQGFVTPEVFGRLMDNAEVFIQDDRASNYAEYENAVIDFLNDASLSADAFRPLIPELWREARAKYAKTEHARSPDAVTITETVADYMPNYNHLANMAPSRAVSSIIDSIVNFSKSGTPPELDPAGREISEKLNKDGTVKWRGIKVTETERAAEDLVNKLLESGVESTTLNEIKNLGMPPSVLVSYLKQMASHWEKQAVDTAQLAMANPDNDILKLNAAKAAALSTIHSINTIANSRELGRAFRQLQVINEGINNHSNVAMEYARVFGTGKRQSERTDPTLNVAEAEKAAARAGSDWEAASKKKSSTRNKTIKKVNLEGVTFGEEAAPSPRARDVSPEQRRRRTLSFITNNIAANPEIKQRVESAASRLKNAFAKLDSEDC